MNFKSPLIILIIILILILITWFLLNQDKMSFSLTNDDSKFNFTLNTENFQDENITEKLNLIAKNLKELEYKISPLKNSSQQFDIPIIKRNYIQVKDYYN